MFSNLASGAKALGLRFSLTGLLPFSLLTAYFFGLYATALAQPGQGIIDAIGVSAKRLGLTGLVLLVMVSIVLAVISQPFQIGVVRLLEGYWGASTPAEKARDFAVELQRRRHHVLRLRRHRLEVTDRTVTDRTAAADFLNERIRPDLGHDSGLRSSPLR
jgi:hypothetical protein